MLDEELDNANQEKNHELAPHRADKTVGLIRMKTVLYNVVFTLRLLYSSHRQSRSNSEEDIKSWPVPPVRGIT
jgi:hypothetical protein